MMLELGYKYISKCRIFYFLKYGTWLKSPNFNTGTWVLLLNLIFFLTQDVILNKPKSIDHKEENE